MQLVRSAFVFQFQESHIRASASYPGISQGIMGRAKTRSALHKKSWAFPCAFARQLPKI